ncbi:Inter-alpha-trypsin inhibitor heavy chain H3 [Hondaea fermentalgiana]|uniref:Inter-alpha-trypsin inhibitor heavy chain H3 n=1 Tax=Hondaea fermentalgiana TaxID=2315210 RepID=A0A2R5GVU7_9STRA|nr:Inter-alpha-trypsin inhibitor heavy chain H3 [Hondaea fermentalgiana]|eukprot:GBG34957.1 Inter-alpha-trypsin inhibitor heavy chain H3 [Hondaea fermentalgiana]
MKAVTASTRAMHKCVRYDEAKQTVAMLTLSAAQIGEDHEKARGGLDLVVVLDKSGSMTGAKLRLCKETCKLLTRELGSNDRLGIIVFDHSVSTALPMTKLSEENKEVAATAIDQIRVGGSTNLSGGLLAGISMLEECVIADAIRGSSSSQTQDLQSPQARADQEGFEARTDSLPFAAPCSQSNDNVPLAQVATPPTVSPTVSPTAASVEKAELPMTEEPASPKERLQMILLLTDGHANSGIRSTDTLCAVASDALDRVPGSTKLFTFGYGNNHNDELLSSLAQCTAGRYAHVEYTDDVQGAFADCIGGALSLVAQNIRVHVKAQGGASIVDEPLTKLTCRRAPADSGFIVEIPDLYAEEKRNILLKLQLPRLTAPVELADDAPVASFDISYADCLGGKLASSSEIVGVARPGGPTDDHEDPEILMQQMRFDSAQVISQAQAQARRGDIEGARFRIRHQLDTLAAAPATVPRDIGLFHCLQSDLQECFSGLRSREEFALKGHKVFSSHGYEYAYERATKTSRSKMSAFRTTNQTNLRSKWEADSGVQPESTSTAAPPEAAISRARRRGWRLVTGRPEEQQGNELQPLDTTRVNSLRFSRRGQNRRAQNRTALQQAMDPGASATAKEAESSPDAKNDDKKDDKKPE